MEVTLKNIGNIQDQFLNSIEKGKELWCCEENLGNKLRIIFGENVEILKRKKFIIDNLVTIPDYRIPSENLIIEFQGYRHFTDCRIAYKDIVKRDIMKKHEINFVEIPYFVQLTKNVINFIFKDIKINICDLSENYPHGFIHPKAEIVGNYCLFGLKIFNKIIDEFPIEVKENCFESLEIRAILDKCPIEVYNPLINKNILNLL